MVTGHSCIGYIIAIGKSHFMIIWQFMCSLSTYVTLLHCHISMLHCSYCSGYIVFRLQCDLCNCNWQDTLYLLHPYIVAYFFFAEAVMFTFVRAFASCQVYVFSGMN